MIKVIYLLWALLCLSPAVWAIESDSDDEIMCEGEECLVQLDEQGDEYHSLDFNDINAVWLAAKPVPGRDPYFFRLDAFNHVIVGRKLAKHNHLGFIALQKADGSMIPVQNEYYGRGNALNHENAIKYDQNDALQATLLDMIEIALRGYLTNSRGSATCWTPSEIHQSMMDCVPNALNWHRSLFKHRYGKYGMVGHTSIFSPMGVFVKQRNPSIDDKTLQTMDVRYELLRIDGFISECSDVIDVYQKPVQNQAKIDAEIKNNWGFRAVAPLYSDCELAENMSRMHFQSQRRATAVDPGEMSPRKKIITTKKNAAVKAKSTAVNVLDDDEFPALGAPPKKKK